MSNVTAILKLRSDDGMNWAQRKELAKWLLEQRKDLLESGDRVAGETVARYSSNPKYNRGRD